MFLRLSGRAELLYENMYRVGVMSILTVNVLFSILICWIAAMIYLLPRLCRS